MEKSSREREVVADQFLVQNALFLAKQIDAGKVDWLFFKLCWHQLSSMIPLTTEQHLSLTNKTIAYEIALDEKNHLIQCTQRD